MFLDVKVGGRLASTTCTTELVVVKAAGGEVDLRCGGVPMVPLDDATPSGGAPVAPFDQGTKLGKRYVTADGGLELLCTKAGAGSVSEGTEPLVVRGPKSLPSSD